MLTQACGESPADGAALVPGMWGWWAWAGRGVRRREVQRRHVWVGDAGRPLGVMMSHIIQEETLLRGPSFPRTGDADTPTGQSNLLRAPLVPLSRPGQAEADKCIRLLVRHFQTPLGEGGRYCRRARCVHPQGACFLWASCHLAHSPPALARGNYERHLPPMVIHAVLLRCYGQQASWKGSPSDREAEVLRCVLSSQQPFPPPLSERDGQGSLTLRGQWYTPLISPSANSR